MSRFKQYMEIIQEMKENKGTDDMYTKFKENLIIYLKEKSLQIAQLISNKIQKDNKIKKDQMNEEETRIKKLEEIFNDNKFKDDIYKAIGKKLLFTNEATQGYFVDFINDMSLEKIYGQIKSQSTIDSMAEHQANKFKQGIY